MYSNFHGAVKRKRDEIKPWARGPGQKLTMKAKGWVCYNPGRAFMKSNIKFFISLGLQRARGEHSRPLATNIELEI